MSLAAFIIASRRADWKIEVLAVMHAMQVDHSNSLEKDLVRLESGHVDGGEEEAWS